MRTLSKSEYEQLLDTAEIVEQDGHGVKVVRLPDGRFLKTFWYRRLISSRRIYPEWLRFSLHAGSLHRRRIPTVDVDECLRIPHLKRTGVIYRPLAGQTVRQAASSGQFGAEAAFRLGRFIAVLHSRGIHFHSLHLGNVLCCPDERYGLIDVSDMDVYPWPLSRSVRLRNFYHLLRYPEDRRILLAAGIEPLIEGYGAEAGEHFRSVAAETIRELAAG